MRLNTALITLLFSHVVHSEKYVFDSSLLGDGKTKVDVSIFNQGGQPPGVYPTDIYVNNNYVRSEDISYENKKNNDELVLTPCLSETQLSKYGVITEDYAYLFDSGSGCADFSKNKEFSFKMNVATQELYLSIPQIALRRTLRGIAPESLWDDGISGFRLNYDANFLRYALHSNDKKTSESYWLNLQPGLNFRGWRLRNQSVWQKNDEYSGGRITDHKTYAYHDITSLKSKLTVGESYTAADLFDSLSFRGVMLSTNENMYPYYFREFGPVIRGVAETQTRIVITHNGNTVYNEILPPGEYVIDDLSVSGQSGELLVTTEDSKGNRTQKTVVWQAPAISVREKYLKYEAMIGKYSGYGVQDNQYRDVAQLSMIYGLPLDLTTYGGYRKTQVFDSYLFGAGISFGSAGSLSFDRTSSIALEKNTKKKGSLDRLRYSGIFNNSRTSFISTVSYSPSDNYRTLNGICTDASSECVSDSLRTRLDAGFRQSLTSGMNVFTSFSVQKNHNLSSITSAMVGFSSTLENIGYLSVNYSQYKTKSQSGEDFKDNVLTANLNIPLNIFKNKTIASSIRISSSKNSTVLDLGLEGSALEQKVNWGVSQSRNLSSAQKEVNNFAFSSLSTPYLDYDASVGKGSGWDQLTAGVSGGLLIHEKGIVATKKLSETISLIDTNGAEYVDITSAQGVRTNSSGYAVVPSVSPYQINNVDLDPSSFQAEDDILITDVNVVPSLGAIARASFKNASGHRMLINVRNEKGDALSFGAVASLVSEDNVTGMVDEHSQLYMSGMPEKGVINVKDSGGMCKMSYDLPQGEIKGIYTLNLICLRK